MAYTYVGPEDGTFNLPIFEVRYLLGDVSPATPFSLTDGEIEYELSVSGGSVRTAAANVAFKMATRYLSESTTSKSVGNTSISKDYAAVAGRFEKLARQIRSGATAGAYPVGIHAISTPVQFSLGQFDNYS